MGVYKTLTKVPSVNGDKAGQTAAPKKNKQRVLILLSRGVTYRHRHLLNDLASMMPHGRKDVKFDTKTNLSTLNELAEMYNCNNVMFFEARKGQDLYIWMSKVPNGPTIKFHAQNLHTMEELHFTGNCLKGSRPILSFDSAFEKAPHLLVIKEVLSHVFGVPEGQRKSKPFTDHVLAFTIADGKIWVRNYQINEVEATKVKGDGGNNNDGITSKVDKKAGLGSEKDTDVDLVEIGPRFVMTPILIQEGSFGGPIIYQNSLFVSPNQVRSDLRRDTAGRHNARAEKAMERNAKKSELGLRREAGKSLPKNELDTRELFS